MHVCSAGRHGYHAQAHGPVGKGTVPDLLAIYARQYRLEKGIDAEAEFNADKLKSLYKKYGPVQEPSLGPVL